MPKYIKRTPPQQEGYTRPKDWLTLPTPQQDEQVVYILAAVWNHPSNFAAILCRGAYTVNWGDGTVENYNDNTQANHTYDYSSIPDATLSSRGYKQVIITIRPQPGSNLTRIEFFRRHPNNATSGGFLQPWLHVKISGQYINFAKFYSDTINSVLLEIFEICGPCSITDCSDMFRTCYALQQIIGLENITPTNVIRMFRGCFGLIEAPMFNLTNCTSLEGTFSLCRNIVKIPDYQTPNVTSLYETFVNCHGLIALPNINTSKVTNMLRMCKYNYSLKYLPAYDLAKVSTAYDAFSYCHSLAYFNSNTLGQVSCNLQLTFSYCYSLETVKNILAKGNSIDYMLEDCRSLSYAYMNTLRNSLNISNKRFSRKALIDLFNALDTISGKTITITGNWGVPYLTQEDIAIATNKGWTVAT